MKEISDIINAYALAIQQNKACALATVVDVQGSSYRRPGARMLVTDDGMLTGAISGGCLEGDALRKAMMAISEGKNKLVTYDTTDEDDAKFGVQLGCNGIVHILFEPIKIDAPNHPIYFLEKVMESRRSAVLTTVFSLQQKDLQPGTCIFNANTESINSLAEAANNFEKVFVDAKQVLKNETSVIIPYELVNAFHQFIKPPTSMIIAGAGNDALPVVQMANMLGWQTIVVDGRPTHANKSRFNAASKILVSRADNALEQLYIDANTVCVLMTHNYNYDLSMLKQLIQTPIPYLGILGPKTKMQRMYDDLEKEGITVSAEQRSRIYSPMGLDIGAETSEEIAVSIVAEIKAVMMGKNAQMLREKTIAIHD